jgi:glycosidase
MSYNKILYVAVLALAISACSNPSDKTIAKTDTATMDGHPAWILNSNIYEVNVRQYTAEGTFNAFAKHLDRLKEMGVGTLWFMPINPISKVDRKGTLGSYYAVSSYTEINPEFGNLEDWNALVKKAHEMGFKVVIDWVPNHTGADHPWLKSHPDFYIQDSTGKAISQFDWTDTRKLNYKNPILVDSMIASMQYWLKTSDIDGFRCDVAPEVADSFWLKAIPILKKEKNIFMLAEGDLGRMHRVGFDATYTWSDFAMMKLIAAGKRPAFALDSVINKNDSSFPANSLRLYFTSNHDENSWNKADFATMPGASHAPFAVLTQTMKRSVPLIYSSQEEPLLRAISFFEKDTIPFVKLARAPFYKKLLNLHTNTPALAANADFKKLVSSADNAIYAYTRSANNSKVLVVLNFTAKPQSVTIGDASIAGDATELFSATKSNIKAGQSFSLPAWGYQVYTY